MTLTRVYKVEPAGSIGESWKRHLEYTKIIADGKQLKVHFTCNMMRIPAKFTKLNADVADSILTNFRAIDSLISISIEVTFEQDEQFLLHENERWMKSDGSGAEMHTSRMFKSEGHIRLFKEEFHQFLTEHEAENEYETLMSFLLQLWNEPLNTNMVE